MTGVISNIVASNQRCDFEFFSPKVARAMLFEFFFPKVARAMLWMVFNSSGYFSVVDSLCCKAPSSFSKAVSNCSLSSDWDILLLSMQALAWRFVWWNFFGCYLNLQHTINWSVACSGGKSALSGSDSVGASVLKVDVFRKLIVSSLLISPNSHAPLAGCY